MVLGPVKKLAITTDHVNSYESVGHRKLLGCPDLAIVRQFDKHATAGSTRLYGLERVLPDIVLQLLVCQGRYTVFSICDITLHCKYEAQRHGPRLGSASYTRQCAKYQCGRL